MSSFVPNNKVADYNCLMRAISLLITLSFLLQAYSSDSVAPVVIAAFEHSSPATEALEASVLKMYQDAKVPYVIRRYPMARALAEVQAGRADALIVHPQNSEEIIEGITPVGPVIKVHRFAVFSTKDHGEDLSKYKIVLLRGMPYVEKALENKDIKFITNPEVKNIVQLLNQERYDATIMSIENEAWGKKLIPKLKRVTSTVLEFPVIHYISSKRPEIIKKFKVLTQ